jgi:hypothetical protein
MIIPFQCVSSFVPPSAGQQGAAPDRCASGIERRRFSCLSACPAGLGRRGRQVSCDVRPLHVPCTLIQDGTLYFTTINETLLNDLYTLVCPDHRL